MLELAVGTKVIGFDKFIPLVFCTETLKRVHFICVIQLDKVAIVNKQKIS